ncbi:disease resistance protein RGA2-like isoform X2 [Carex rostrata]
MVGNLITSLLSLATNLLPSMTASTHASSSSSSSSNNSERGRARAVREDLERLMQTLEQIKATLYDAEEREVRDRSVKLWLKELRKVAYDAEDVLSEYQYEVTRVQVEARKASEASGLHKRKQIGYIVPIPDGIVDRLNKIRSRFDEIAKDREALQLSESDGARRPNNKLLRPPTGHMIDEASIFGRDDEVEEVSNLLLSEKEKPFSVISIIGKGGLGKTTIAQLVYKDEEVSQCFDLKGWVCVSEEFDVRRVIKATIESFSKINCGLSELSQLQDELAKIVKGNTILLVLDDVWNENRNLWELFRVPFKEARMVRILVTTRNEKVAKVVTTTTCFNPSNLSEYSCWQLFEHYAFSGTCYTMPKHLVDMGREITIKCGGLPLAVKSIASLLRHETDEEVWTEILESGLWEIKESKEEIFPALQISYAHLPAHLKPCFLFCSMYPKDYVLKKMDLIRSWIAHGYIVSRRNREITEIGVEYYNELKERSFLDDADYAYIDAEKDYSKLHDIIHDLARLNSKNEHYSVEINQPLDIQERTVLREVYHLYVGGSMGLGYVNRIPQENLKGLRTIIIDMGKHLGTCEEYFDPNLELMDDCQDSWKGVTLCNLTKFKVLRVLILKWYSLTKIPHSISELKHLTYLSIRSTRLKMLPLSIGLLYNLLDLQVHCYYLEYLPENIGDLANLQFLYIYSGGELKEIPKSLCSLTNLQELTIDYGRFLDYVPHSLVNFPSIRKVGAWWKVRTIGWLKDMKDLKGMLCIEKLKNINNLEDAKRANLRNKCKLEILELHWDYKGGSIGYAMDSQLELKLVPEACEGGIAGIDDVHFSLLECLQPHPNLMKLLVSGYPSTIVPGWMRDPLLLQSIEELRLGSCGYIQSLPFGNLHTLKYLYITECSSIRTIQLEQLPSQLENLIIERCDHLELITGFGHLDILKRLSICWCKTLKSLTMDGLQLVESTELFGDLSHEIPQINRQSISSLTRLTITSCGSLHLLPDWLIPSGPCDVSVYGCGCPDYYKGFGPRPLYAYY